MSANDLQLLCGVVEQEGLAHLIGPHLKLENFVCDDVIPVCFCCHIAGWISRRPHSFDSNRIIKPLTRQKRDETLKSTFRLVVLIKQEDELMPKQILQDHRRFRRKIGARLIRFPKSDSCSFEVGGKQYLVAE